jgi:hypothetical protein
MLGKIGDELAKKIATDLYDYAKKKGGDIQKELKNTALRANGNGLPPPLLVAFQESFVRTLTNSMFLSDGYARWPYRSTEGEIELLLRQPLVASIQKTDWVEAAQRTADGLKQIAALGGKTEYQAAVSRTIGGVLNYTVSKYVGHLQTTDKPDRFWMLLSEVIKAPAAPKGTETFADTEFLYWCFGDKQDVKTKHKLSKEVLMTGSLWWKKYASPSVGPFLTRPGA